jgi:hypothetical protein
MKATAETTPPPIMKPAGKPQPELVSIDRCLTPTFPNGEAGIKNQPDASQEAKHIGKCIDCGDVIVETGEGAVDPVDAAQRALIGSKEQREDAKEADQEKRRQQEEIGQQRLTQATAAPSRNPGAACRLG